MAQSSRRSLPTRYFCITSSKNPELRQVEAICKSYLDETELPELYFCVLKDNWSQTAISTGDVLHIFNAQIIDSEPVKTRLGSCPLTLIIDNHQGLMVLNPDLLMPTTTLMGASHCMRKIWLQSMFNVWGETSLPLLLGSAAHELFQTGLRRRIYDMDGIKHIFHTEILKTLTFDLYSLGMTVTEFQQAIEPYFVSIARWLQTYMAGKRDPKEREKKHFVVKKLHDIENEIWSTKYGVIGKMDITLEAVLTDGDGKQRLLPLELKTGKHTYSAAHMGQVIMYSYIIQDKYRQEAPNDGYLIYLKDDVKTELVRSNHNTFRDIIIIRNTFQAFHNKIMDLSSKIDNVRMEVPDRISNLRFCQSCEYLTECSLFYNAFESKSEIKSTQTNIFETAISHLSTSDVEFFSKNITLLEIEKQYAIHKEQMEKFWNLSSEDCETAGMGFAKLEIVNQRADMMTLKRTSKLNGRMTNILGGLAKMINGQSVNYESFVGRRVMINEEILVSKACFAIFGNYCRQTSCGMAYIEGFNSDHTEVVLRLEKEIIIELNPRSVYRLDLLHLQSQRPMNTNFANIARLMSPNDDRCRELRDIVIRGLFPKCNINTSILVSLQKVITSPIIRNLNPNQKKAVIGVLRTRCSLIFGCPGSGKTETIVALVRVLHSLGFSVLVTSFTHVAVDNILDKLIKSNITNNEKVDFVRIGALSRIKESVRLNSEHELTKKWIDSGNVEALSNFYSNIKVVACTALGVAGHSIFQKRTFDYCILDEASQVVLATCLGPLFMSKNFVLVGDQKQLPPVVQNVHSKKDGLEESLFSRLLGFVGMNQSKIEPDTEDVIIDDVIVKKENSPQKKRFVARPDSIRVYPLFIQYRMNREIMSLPNQLTYSGKLTCGNDEIEYGTLKKFLSDKNADQAILEGSYPGYLERALSYEIDDSVVFLDIDRIMDAKEVAVESKDDTVDTSTKDGVFGLKKSGLAGYVYNEFEAKLIDRLIHELLTVYGQGGLMPANIGVVSPFRKQVQKLKELIGSELIDQQRLEINTVDQYQGRDKEVIIYSCVKSFVQLQDSGFFDTENSQFSNVSDVSSSSSNASSTLLKGVIDSELLKDERRLNVAITRAKKKLIIVGNRSTLYRYEPFRNLFAAMRDQMFVPLCEHGIKDSSSLC